jgi:hypothetical protein
MLNPLSLATQGFGMATSILGDAVRMAAEEEAAIAQLTQAIEANVEGWDGNIAVVEEVIAQREALAFADSEQRESLQKLVAVTGDVNEALALQATAMDLARLRNMELGAAGDLLGKVYAGNLGTLSKFGIVLDKGATSVEAMAEIQRMARGQAKAYAETTQGSLVRSQLALENAMEDLGAALTPVVGTFADMAADTIPKVLDAVGDLVGVVQGAHGAFLELRDTVHETVGRDIENDLSNAARIGATFGTVLVSDVAGEAGFALEDLARQLGLTGDSFESYTGEAERASNAMATLPGAVSGAAGDIAGTLRRVLDEAAEFPEGLRDAIASGKDDVREAMADLRFAMEHPFAGDRYADFLRDKMRAANRALARAIAEGRVDAANEAAAVVAAIKGELGKLGNQTYSLDVMLSQVPGISESGAMRFLGPRGGSGGSARPRGGGRLTPDDSFFDVGRGSGRGGGVNVNINGGLFMGNPGDAQRFAREVTPHIERERRRLGVGG